MNTDYASKIVKNAFKIGAITLNPTNPYTWASGYRMPIYNDNRKHLQSHEYRMTIAQAIKDLIKKNGLEFELLSGTPTAGIAPAATLSQLIGKKLVVENKGEYFNYDLLAKELIEKNSNDFYDLIVSTSPHAIAPSVQFANHMGVGFAYIRSSKKDHGLQQQIEGVIKQGQNVLLIDCHIGDSYLDLAKKELENFGCEITAISQDISNKIEKIDVKGKKLLEFEDHISLGGSSIERVKIHKSNGAEPIGVASISNYGFPKMFNEFKEADCKVYSAVWYSDIINGAREENKFSESELEMLSELKEQAFDWGELHGFPKVIKTK